MTASSVEDLLLRPDAPALGLSIVADGELVWSAGAAADTLFQAGSISKAIAAYAALELVRAGLTDLDRDLGEGTTLRRLLTHTAGFGAPFCPGYEHDTIAPSFADALATVQIEHEPGAFHYSGGGFVVVQRVISELTGQPFPHAARTLVFDPLGMRHSTFEQPIPERLRARAARGDWRVYPEAAAAGLWTTPRDLGRFVIGVQRTTTGQAMLTPAVDLPAEGDWTALAGLGIQPPDRCGLGTFLVGSDRFIHPGGAPGFFSLITGSTSDGTGGAIMSAADPTALFFDVASAAADEWNWHGFRTGAP